MNSSLTENRASDDWANAIDTSGRANRALVRYPSATAHPSGWTHVISLGRGASEGCGAGASAEVRSAGRQRRFVGLGVFGVTSCAAVLCRSSLSSRRVNGHHPWIRITRVICGQDPGRRCSSV